MRRNILITILSMSLSIGFIYSVEADWLDDTSNLVKETLVSDKETKVDKTSEPKKGEKQNPDKSTKVSNPSSENSDEIDSDIDEALDVYLLFE